jgi:hypothetical protein
MARAAAGGLAGCAGGIDAATLAEGADGATAGAAVTGASASGKPSANACTAVTNASASDSSGPPLRNFHCTPIPISCRNAVLRIAD